MGMATRQNATTIIPDLNLFYAQQQALFAGEAHLLRGFMMNEEYAELQKAELAGPQAEIAVAQKRQNLYLAGAVQYWDWQVAVKQNEVQQRALAVAEERYTQIEGQAKRGLASPLDVIEANQEVQRRREAAIAAQRKVEYEQYKLSLSLGKRRAGDATTGMGAGIPGRNAAPDQRRGRGL